MLDVILHDALKKAKEEKKANKKALKELEATYNIDAFFCEVNQTYKEFDEGIITESLAKKRLRICCKKFLVSNRTSNHIDVWRF